MPKRTYTKKVIVTDEHSTAEARGLRLKRARGLANLSRRQMCDEPGLNLNTLKGWELGRYGGLPRDGANRAIRRLRREGVYCQLEWLLYGHGAEPSLAPTGAEALSSSLPNNAQTERTLIQKELALFQSHHPEAISSAMNDDGMLPRFEKGDRVAGIPCRLEAIHCWHKKACLVELKTGETVIRQAWQRDSVITLQCINPMTSVVDPIVHDAPVAILAPIVWHRKVNF